MLTDDEIIYKYHGIDDCLHTNAGENGLATREDGSIKCYDCGRVFDCLSDLTKDTAAQAIKLARAAEQADMAKRNEIHEKYHELNDKDIEAKARSEGYKQGQIDAVKHLFENKIAMVRAVKVLSEDMQDVAKKAGYKPDDVLFITMEKIEGGMVIKGSVAKCDSDELVIKKVD